MKYIDRFPTLDDFLSSELQQLTGDRIATIDGFTLPILKKKLKTVTTIDPSTNEEVETEELQDVWMVPVGENEKKVEHDFSFITNDKKCSFTSSFTYTKNLYNFDIDTTTDSNNNLTRAFRNMGVLPEFALLDNGLSTWGWTVTTDNSKFSTTLSQSGYSVVPNVNSVHSYNTSWNNGYYYLRRMYTSESTVVPNFIKQELLNKKTSQSLTQDIVEIHDNACTIQYGASNVPISLNWIYNIYYSQYPQGFDINDIKLTPKLSLGNNAADIIDSYTYDSSTRTLTVHIPNYSGSENLYSDIKINGVGDYSFNYIVLASPFNITPTDSESEYTWANPYFRNTTSLQDTTLEYDLTAANHWQMQNYWILYKDNTGVLVSKNTFSNIHLKIVVGNGGASAATGLTFSASPQTATSTDLTNGYAVLDGTAMYNGESLGWTDLAIDWTTGITILSRESGSDNAYMPDALGSANIEAYSSSYKVTWSDLANGKDFKIIIPFNFINKYYEDFVIELTTPSINVVQVLGTMTDMSDISATLNIANGTAGNSGASSKSFNLVVWNTDGNGNLVAVNGSQYQTIDVNDVSVSVSSNPSGAGYSVQKLSSIIDVYFGDQNSPSSNTNKSVEYTITFTYGGLSLIYTVDVDWCVIITENEPDRKSDGQGYRADTTIKKVIVSEGVTSLGESAFNGCTSLEEVTLPSTLTRLGLGCFIGTKITSITIPNGCRGNSDDAYNNGSSYGHLGYGTFMNCTSLTSVSIPSTITAIDSVCFRGCTNLTSITLPNSITKIASEAFYGTGLTSIQLPQGCQYESNSFPSGCTITYKSNS